MTCHYCGHDRDEHTPLMLAYCERQAEAMARLGVAS